MGLEDELIKRSGVTVPTAEGPAPFGSWEAAKALAPVWGMDPIDAHNQMVRDMGEADEDNPPPSSVRDDSDLKGTTIPTEDGPVEFDDYRSTRELAKVWGVSEEEAQAIMYNEMQGLSPGFQKNINRYLDERTEKQRVMNGILSLFKK